MSSPTNPQPTAPWCPACDTHHTGDEECPDRAGRMAAWREKRDYFEHPIGEDYP